MPDRIQTPKDRIRTRRLLRAVAGRDANSQLPIVAGRAAAIRIAE